MTQEEFIKRYTYSPSRDRIGGGGFGTVYKAKDNLLHRTVAIKVSVVKTTADGKKTFSLKDEFEALNHVPKHPNIANYEEFYSFESPQGLFDYAVMQFYPDGNLSNAIKQGLTAEQKEDIAKQLLEGISFLHKHNVVHRDLKPGNILIVKEGDKVIPLITDFGLSKSTGVIDGSVFSNSFGAGTPRYSSPEQLQVEPLRFNTDLWSFGAIIYELFTGEQLFSAGSGAANTAQADLEIYNKIVNGNVSGLGIMPEKWRKVAERCLVVDAAKRAKNVEELFGVYNDNGCGTPKDTSSTFIQNNVTMVNPPIVNDEIRMENQTSSSVAKKSVVDRTVCIISNNKGIWWKQAVALSLLSLVFAGLFGVFLSDSDMNGFIVFAGCLICLLLLSAYLWVHVLLFRWLSKKVKVMHWVLAFFSVFLIVFGLLSDFYFGIVVCFFAVVVSTAGLLVYRPEKLKFLPYLVIAILGFLFIYFLMTDNQNIDNDNRFICFMGALSTIVYLALIILMTIKDRKVMKSPLKQDT